MKFIYFTFQECCGLLGCEIQSIVDSLSGSYRLKRAGYKWNMNLHGWLYNYASISDLIVADNKLYDQGLLINPQIQPRVINTSK